MATNINLNEKSSASQCKRIAQYLNEGNTLTGLEAIPLFGCIRLASRINDLRKKGMEICSRTIKTIDGKRVSEYYING